MKLYYIVSNGFVHSLVATDKCRATIEAMIILKCSFSHASEMVLDPSEYIASFDWKNELELANKQMDIV